MGNNIKNIFFVVLPGKNRKVIRWLATIHQKNSPVYNNFWLFYFLKVLFQSARIRRAGSRCGKPPFDDKNNKRRRIKWKPI